MRTYIIAVLLALACFSLPRPSLAADPASFMEVHQEFIGRLKLVKSYETSITVLMRLPEGRSATARKFFREHLVGDHTKPRLAIVIVPGKREGSTYAAFGGDIDRDILFTVNQELNNALSRKDQIEIALITALNKLGIVLPDPPQATAEPPRAATPPQHPVPPPRLVSKNESKILRKPALQAPTPSRLPYFIALAVLAVLTVVCAYLAYWVGRRSGQKRQSLTPAPHLSDDELLKKWGFEAQDFDYKAYEKNFRDRLYFVGMQQYFLLNLVEAAAAKYPMLWNGVRGRLQKGSRYLAQEVTLRHLGVTINQAQPRKERVVEVCRCLEILSDPIRFLCEAYEGQLAEHFGCFATLRENHSEIEKYRQRLALDPHSSSPKTSEVFARYDRLCADIMNGVVGNWAAVHLELTIVKTELDALFHTDGVPLPIKKEPPTQRLSLTGRFARDQSLSHMRTAVPQGNNDSGVVVLIEAAQAP